MRRRAEKTLDQRIAERIARKKGEVFLRADFRDLGGYDQIGRTLRKLIARGILIRIGYGLYARASVSPFSGRPVPRKNLPALAKEALEKLKVDVRPSQGEAAYNAGRSTQVPTGRVIGVGTRISRKIGYAGKYVNFEHSP